MARQLSGDQQNLRVGISSFSEDKTSLVVIGKVGINTDEAMQALHVEGNAYISGSIGIGTSTPSDAVDPSNTTVLNVGIVTANELYGEGKELTGIITSAYNLSGGDDGKLVIQSAPGVTSYFDYGPTGFALISRGSSNPPQWAAAAAAGAIEGLLLFEEGALVGGGNSYGGLDFRGSAVTVVGAGTPANIGTVFVSGDFDGGVNITGGGFTMSIGGNTVAGIDTFGNLSVGAALTVAGLSTFHNSISVGGSIFPLPGMALTYYGDGQYLENIITGIGVQEEADPVSYGATIIKFVGPTITVSDVDPNTGVATVTVNVTGTATTATNLAGGDAGDIPFQSAANTTTFVDASSASTGQVLLWNGSTPFWGNVSAAADAFGGISVQDESTPVGTAGSIATLNFVGSNIQATASAGANGISTITMSDTPTFDGLTVSGIATIGSVKISSGIVTASSGVVTYYGDGSLTSLSVSGLSTFTGIGTFQSDLFVGGNVNIVGVLTAERLYSNIFGELTGGSFVGDSIVGTALSISGISTLGFTTVSNLYVSGITTSDGGFIGNLTGTASTASFATTAFTLNGVAESDLNVSFAQTAGIATTATNLADAANITTGTISSDRLTGSYAIDITGNAGTASTASFATTAFNLNGVVESDLNVAFAQTAGLSTETTKLQTSRTFEITGDVVASPITFDGTGNVSLAATIQPNSVGLGTDTFGDYVKSITGTSNEVTVSVTSGEGSTPQIGLPNDVTIGQDLTVTRDVEINRNLNVNGNITIGGTSATLFTQTLTVADPDLVLGVRTDALGNDISTDNTANHGGIAIASTEGNPLIILTNPGAGETLPSTYKKIMWFKSGSFSGLGTDAWLSNYAIGIGSTQFPTGTRLAAGNVQITENDLSVVRNINASGIVTASGGFEGSLTGTATTATNLAGGDAGDIPFQSAANTTTFVDASSASTGQVLLWNGSTPFWGNVSAAADAFGGISVQDESTPVGTAGSIATLNFVGSNIQATASAGANGISTITMSDTPTFDGLTVSGIATIGSVKISSGIVTASSFTGNLTGTATTATNLSDAANITTGTINSDRLTGSYGINITGNAGTASTASFATTAFNLANAANITTGTISSDRLSGSYAIDITGNAGTASTASFATTAFNLNGAVESDLNVAFAQTAGIATYTSEWTLGANGTSDYTFTGPGFTGAENDPTLYLTRGQQYKFINNTGGHPFRIQSTPNGSVGTQYNDGITNNDAGDGTTLLWNVQFDSPDILYYQCTSHSSMGGKIYIVNAGIASDVNLFTTGIATIGNVEIGAGIVTSTTGIVTYYGDGSLTSLSVSGLSTFTGIGTFQSDLFVGGNVNIVGVLTAERLYSNVYGEFTGGSFVGDSIVGTALSISGISTLGTVEISSGIITATSGVVTYYGDGSNLTGLTGVSADKIEEGNTKAEVIDTGSDGRFIVETEGVERLRIDSTGNVGIGTTNPDAALHVVDDILVSAGSAATLDVRIKTYADENGSISFENAVDGVSIFTLQQGDSDTLFEVTTSPTNQVFQVGVDSSIIVSSGVQTADFKIKAYTDELGSLSFEDVIDGTQYFSINQDLSTLFAVNDANFNTVFSVDPDGDVAISGDINLTAGIITATSGVVTYYGDGQYLQNVNAGIDSITISNNILDQSQYLTFAVSTGDTTGLGVTTEGLVFNPSLNHLGIGTTNPDAALHVVDDILVSAGSAATLDVRIKTYADENGSISFENAVDGTSIFTLQQGDSDTLFEVSTSPTNQVFQVGVDSSIIVSSGVSTADFKIKAYDDELGSLSFEDVVDGTQYFSITQDLSTLLFGVNDANLNTVFVVDPNGNVGVKTDSIGASRALDVYGNAVISGSITKGSGTFTIPHPIDSSKLLVHSFIEGPRADLIYRGKSQLSNGISTVMMDSHIGIITGTWKALCRNPQVFLQNNESFALVKSTITDDGILTITSNENTNATIDWMVVAERQDEVIKNANWTDDDGNPILEPSK